MTGTTERDAWPEEVRDSWPAQWLASEFDLDPFLASAQRHENLREGELEVEVDHPHHVSERTQVPLAGGVERTNGTTVHQVRVRLVRPRFWPEFTLAVRDADTRTHLEDIELRIVPGAWAAAWGWNQPETSLAAGLSSPIALMGGRHADEPEDLVAGLALSPAASESPRLVELVSRMRLEQGVIVSARAPGYAWGSIVLDVSTSDERELLLRPGDLACLLRTPQIARNARGCPTWQDASDATSPPSRRLTPSGWSVR